VIGRCLLRRSCSRVYSATDGSRIRRRGNLRSGSSALNTRHVLAATATGVLIETGCTAGRGCGLILDRSTSAEDAGEVCGRALVDVGLVAVACRALREGKSVGRESCGDRAREIEAEFSQGNA
jgi:hypothetical protein